jgi:hypothetical protein
MVSVETWAQDDRFIEDDSIAVSDGVFTFSDSLVLDSTLTMQGVNIVAPPLKEFKPNPTKAVIYSAVFPGLGQIYNRKYWKLPLVYGGFIGCIYACSWNGSTYTGYKSAFQDFMDSDPNTKSWEAYVNSSIQKLGTDPSKWPESDRNWFGNTFLKNRKDYYRRYRDMSYIFTVAFYAICMIDAYVDAQLFDFDISPDLSLKVEPFIIPQTTIQSRSFGLQCSIAF